MRALPPVFFCRATLPSFNTGLIARPCMLFRNYAPTLGPATTVSDFRQTGSVAQVSSPARPPPLSSAKDINIGRLAGAIANRLRRDEACEIRAVGPSAQHSAVKAIIMVHEWFKKDGEFTGISFALDVRQVDLPSDGHLPPSKMCHIELLPIRRELGSEKPHEFVRGDDNPGLVAGKLKNRLQHFPSIELSSMGPMATSRALKALIIAKTYIQKSTYFRADQNIVAIVRAEEIVERLQGARQRLRWTCVLDPA